MIKNKISIYSALKINRQPPHNVEVGKGSDFFKQVDVNFDVVDLNSYDDVYVSPEGIVFKGLSVEREHLIYPKHEKVYNAKYIVKSRIKRKCVRLPKGERYLLCFDYWSNSIFHWMCDVMPRLQAIKEQTKDLVLLLPANFEYPYIHETLAVFQFKSIYFIPINTYVRCLKLLVPDHITVSGKIRPDNFKALRTTILNHFEPNFSNRFNFSNIYISRNKAKYRKVINESELLPILAAYNYQLIYFEDYKVSEQIEICYNAKNFVSIHGANLTNTIFMKPNSNVMELRKKGDLENNYFYEIADAVDCNYFHLDCDFEDPVPNYNFFSLYVNVKDFELGLKLLAN